MLPVVDLFCGAGGLSLGFQNAGFRVIQAFDSWEIAAQTYRINHGGHVSTTPIHEEMELPACSVIIGGPPCQGFSSAGMRNGMDSRNNLVRVYAKIIARVRPKAFVFENVEGFLTGGDGNFVVDLLTPLIEAGYRIHLRKINAANFGVPQHRKRVIAIGGLGWDPGFPESTHSAHGAPGAHLATQILPPTPTLGDALRGMPKAVVASDVISTEANDHIYRALEGIDLERARRLNPGQTMRDLPVDMWHESYRRRANRRVMDGTPSEKRGGAPAGLRRLTFDEPSKAITSGAVSEFLHPSEQRNLTLRECARIQTFPDHFQFSGGKNERALLIGNAVPPVFAKQIAATLMKDLLSDPNAIYDRGELLSFVPTLSTGLSPALQATVAKVECLFRGRQSVIEQGAFWC